MSHPGNIRFTILALSPDANHVIHHPRNQHLLSKSLPDALEIGGHAPKGTNGFTIATFGRGCDADVYVEARNSTDSQSVSRIQCSIEYSEYGASLMFYDRSTHGSCQTHGETAMPLLEGSCPRRVAMLPHLNTDFGFGRKGKNLFRFRFKWPCEAEDLARTMHACPKLVAGPDMARTVDPVDDPAPEKTSLFMPRPKQQNPRLKMYGNPLGAGNFAVVWEAIDVDTGRPVAVKMPRNPDDSSMREAHILSQFDHPHIVRSFGSFETICMERMDGTLTSLAETPAFLSESKRAELANTVFEHVLRALNCIADAGIVHRDVKPDNIFYKQKGDVYTFKLGDFGLSNYQRNAKTFAGSELYMAPEMYTPKVEQTHKADVWSLFVTMVWTLDINNFRRASGLMATPRDVQDAIALVLQSNNPGINSIRGMAEFDPQKRASAADMLAMLAERGRKTPRNVPPALAYGTADTLHAEKGRVTVPAERYAHHVRKRSSTESMNHCPGRQESSRRQRRQRQRPPLRLQPQVSRQRQRPHPQQWHPQRQRPLGTSFAMPGAFPSPSGRQRRPR